MNQNESDPGFNRRDFLKSGSFASLMTMMGGVQLFAQQPADNAAAGETKENANVIKVKVAVIGLGAWGRELLNTLGTLAQADVAAICDTYAPFLKRAAKLAPNATQTEDHKTILENKEIPAVIIATPTHLHKDLAIAALKAGKHVYCEAPLANTIEDAKAIALAAKAAPMQAFQPGLQMRAEPQRHFLRPFIHSGALGTPIMARAQWHKKQSWRAVSSNPEQEKAMNWRLNKQSSLGLIGEIGIHQIDQAGWFLKSRPVAITGFSSLAFWNKDNREHPDDRDVPDTVQAIFEFPKGVRLSYDATLANSFDAECEVYYGSDAAVLLRDNKAWMFKETDSPLLDWEVYAAKSKLYGAETGIVSNETGIALIADASKSNVKTKKAPSQNPFENTPIAHALGAFLKRAGAIQDFRDTYPSAEPSELQDTLSHSALSPAPGYLEGFQATVTAIKANEAISGCQRLEFNPKWYELG